MKNSINTVLVIDDNETNRHYLKRVFSNNNINVFLASSGLDALDYLKENKPDLILVDIQMPEMDGFVCYERIKEDFGIFCPILAITAFSSLADRSEVIDFGFHDFIQKPVKPNALLNTINFWIENGVDNGSNNSLSIDSHIDHSVIEELIHFTDQPSVIALIDEFIEETKSEIQSLAFLKSSKNYTEILSILHSIKGNSGSFGFVGLSAKAIQLENQIKKNKLQSIDLELDELIEYSKFLIRDYQRLLKFD